MDLNHNKKRRLSHKQNHAVKKKRRFCGNRFTQVKTNADEQQQPEQQQSGGQSTMSGQTDSTPTFSGATAPVIENSEKSTREKKIEESANDELNDNDFSYLWIDFEILKSVIQLFSCPDCQSPVDLQSDKQHRMGFSNKLLVICPDCDWKHSFFTSKNIKLPDRNVQGRTMFDVNVRAVLSFREIGRGHESLLNFSRCMNMTSLSNRTYQSFFSVHMKILHLKVCRNLHLISKRRIHRNMVIFLCVVLTLMAAGKSEDIHR